MKPPSSDDEDDDISLEKVHEDFWCSEFSPGMGDVSKHDFQMNLSLCIQVSQT